MRLPAVVRMPEDEAGAKAAAAAETSAPAAPAAAAGFSKRKNRAANIRKRPAADAGPAPEVGCLLITS